MVPRGTVCNLFANKILAIFLLLAALAALGADPSEKKSAQCLATMMPGEIDLLRRAVVALVEREIDDYSHGRTDHLSPKEEIVALFDVPYERFDLLVALDLWAQADLTSAQYEHWNHYFESQKCVQALPLPKENSFVSRRDDPNHLAPKPVKAPKRLSHHKFLAAILRPLTETDLEINPSFLEKVRKEFKNNPRPPRPEKDPTIIVPEPEGEPETEKDSENDGKQEDSVPEPVKVEEEVTAEPVISWEEKFAEVSDRLFRYVRAELGARQSGALSSTSNSTDLASTFLGTNAVEAAALIELKLEQELGAEKFSEWKR